MPARLSGLRERVTIQTPTRTTDTQGGAVVAWGVLDVVWAAVVPMRASERLQLEQIGSHVDTRLRIRARSDVTAKMRVVWTPSWEASPARRTMEVHGVTPDPNDPTAYALLDCGEVV